MPDVSAWSEFLRKVAEAIWQEYGPLAALLLLFWLFHLYMFHRMYERRLKEKDAEIERLVQNRNKLQDALLADRLSSDSRYQEELPLKNGGDDGSS